MVRFGERLADQMGRLGLRQVDLVELFNKDRRTISAYVNNRRTPDYSDLIVMAPQLGVSIDWLAGVSSGPRWSPAVLQMQSWLKVAGQAAQSEDDDWVERIQKLVRLIQDHLPISKESWFMAGVLGLHSGKGLDGNAARFDGFMESGANINDDIVQRFADFAGVSAKWVMRGKPEYWQPLTAGDLGSWGPIMLEYQRLGQDPITHQRYIPVFDEMYRRNEQAKQSILKDDETPRR